MSTKEKSSFELVASVGLKKYHFTFSLSSSSFQRLPEIFIFDTFYECQCLEQNCSIEAQVTLDNEDDSDGKSSCYNLESEELILLIFAISTTTTIMT